ncbi:MAG: rhomboid family intramembrane serine protease [Gammaproteobacteria bacterium]|nr:rhomboid family intramembrane serine protease [Gammaproteobacteria bacterium]
MFIPIGPKIHLTIIPWTTVLIALLCTFTTWQQQRSNRAIESHAEKFCTVEIVAQLQDTHPSLSAYDQERCVWLLGHILMRSYYDGQDHLQWHLDLVEKKLGREASAQFQQLFDGYAKSAPPYLTASLWEDVNRWNPLRSLTGSLAHGSWDHLVGNLFFFFAFALIVETAIGSGRFLLICIAMALGIGVLQNVLAFGERTVTVGLSGVVMATMTLAAYLAPTVKIRFFYWFFVHLGVLMVPLWAIAIWYVFWDLYDQLIFRGLFNINYIAHLCGAVMGLVLGMTLYRDRREKLADNIFVDERDPLQDETWLQKFNAIFATPVVLGFAFVFLFVLLGLVFKLIVDFALQLVIVSPVLFAIWGMKRIEKQARPDWERFQEAMQYVRDEDDVEAVKHLQPLAQSGYSRAQYELACLLQRTRRMHREYKEAADWLTRAAKAGHAQAQYRLGNCYVEGMGLDKNIDQAMHWYEKAMKNGLADAAMTLAHLWLNHPEKPRRDRERAVSAYQQAAVLFARNGDKEGEQVALASAAQCQPA